MNSARADNRNTGIVWLVGAGPGDPGLLTLKGRDCIANAECVYYDALVNTALLDYVAPDAECVYVGKKAGSHHFTQARINAMLADKALDGRRVCRLKGGDPFVFGRGGEEALYLRERGVRVEIVPGVSAAVAVPAYAGIPVTHRGSAASLRVITGHDVIAGAETECNWETLGRERGTLVVLMGHRNLEQIVARLMKYGMSGDTPAAVISKGTSPEQRVVTAPLGIIAVSARQAATATPALLIIGEVVRLSASLAWFDQEAGLMEDRFRIETVESG